MSGHSKWHNIRIRKAKQDAVRGKLLSKVSREIIVAARMGGGDPKNNPSLRAAIEKAREVGMPKENIERAIKRGTGEIGEGEHFEEVVYEGYGAGGVALLVEALTDNRNRTTSQLRRLFQKHGGSLGEAGCVAWMFERKALVMLSQEATDEDTVMTCALEAEADDVAARDEIYEIVAAPKQLEAIKQALINRGIKFLSATITNLPKQTVRLEGQEARKVLLLLQDLENEEDVRSVSANFDIPDEILEEMSEAA